MTQATTKAKIENLKVKAEAVHIAALNLSNTLGVFHGINNSLEGGALGGPEIRAVNVIQSDLLHLLGCAPFAPPLRIVPMTLRLWA